MRDFTANVFDEYISGTTTTWYTSSGYNDLLGSADWLTVQAVPGQVAGGTPTLTLAYEHSCNGLDWLPVGLAPFSTMPEISSAALINDVPVFGNRTVFAPPLLSFVRFRISLGGSATACRLKVWVTGRVSKAI